MAINVKDENKEDFKNAYLKLREVSIQDSGVVILKTSLYKSEKNRKDDINKGNTPKAIYLKDKEAKEFIDLVFGKAYKILSKKLPENIKILENN